MTLERKNEMLKKKIQSMLLRENRSGLNPQDQYLKKQFIRELYGNTYQLNSSRA
jgi:hypothetical protein